MRCPSCGAEISDEALYCPYCGAQVMRTGSRPVDQLRRAMGRIFERLPIKRGPQARCPNCGAELGPEARFCVNCGYTRTGPEAS